MQASTETPLTVLLDRDGSQLTVNILPVRSEDGSRSLLGIYAKSAERQATLSYQDSQWAPQLLKQGTSLQILQLQSQHS